jgi:hypothetical protein
MKYKGVIFDKVTEEIPGSSLRELKDGRMKECKPKFRTLGYAFHDGYPYDTVKELKEVVDRIHEAHFDGSGTQEEWLEVMNGSQN